MNTNIKQNIKAIILGLILTAGISLTLADGAWTAPTCSPPECNASAPINVSNSAQIKTGKLGIGWPDSEAKRTEVDGVDAVLQVYGKFLANSGAVINGPLVIANGSQGNDRYLKSDADGKATWADLSGGGGNINVRTTKLNRITSWWIEIEGVTNGSPIGKFLSDRPGLMFSDNPVTLNHLCAIMYPSNDTEGPAPYILSYQQMQWSSPEDNTTLYWDNRVNKFKSINSAQPDPLTPGITSNSGINGNAPFSCTSVVTKFKI